MLPGNSARWLVIKLLYHFDQVLVTRDGRLFLRSPRITTVEKKIYRSSRTVKITKIMNTGLKWYSMHELSLDSNDSCLGAKSLQ
jgi:hypothetical protein